MEIKSETILLVSKQRISELESELLDYRALCTQQQIVINALKNKIEQFNKEDKEDK